MGLSDGSGALEQRLAAARQKAQDEQQAAAAAKRASVTSGFDKAYQRAVDSQKNAKDQEAQDRKEALAHQKLAESLTEPYFVELANRALPILRKEGVRLGKSWLLPSSRPSITLDKYRSNLLRRVWTLNAHGFLRLHRNGDITHSGAVLIGGQETWEALRREAISDYARGPYLWYDTNVSELKVAGSTGQNQIYSRAFLDYGATSIAWLVEAWHERKP